MAAQAPELPAGREPMPDRWCYFCGRVGKSTKGSARGAKKVRFVRYRRTQPSSLACWSIVHLVERMRPQAFRDVS